MEKKKFLLLSAPDFIRILKRALLPMLFVFIACILIQKVRNFDIWWHLKTGEYILANHFVPKHDIFSYTVPANAWFNHQWLADVLFFSIYKGFGLSGLVLLKTLVLGAAFFVVFTLCFRKKLYILSVALTILAVLASEHRFLIRPFIFNFFFVGFYFYILHNYKHKNTKLIFLLPLLHIFWTNVHGGSLMGVILIFSFLIGEAAQRMEKKKYRIMLYVAIATMLASLINPNGLNGALYPFLTLSGLNNSGYQQVVMKYITELQPPLTIYDFLKINPYPYYKIMIFVSLAGFALNYKRLNITHLIIYVTFLAFSLKANRNIPSFAILAAPITIFNLESANIRATAPKLLRKISPTVLELLLLLGLIGCMLSLILIATAPRYLLREKVVRSFGFGAMDAKYPKDAVDFIEKNDIKGNMFNAYEMGGYIIWRLFPKRKVFIDGRTEVYGPKFYQGYMDLTTRPWEFDKVAKGFDINYMILSRIYIDSDAFIEYIYKNDIWKLVFFDEISCVFIKNTARNKDIIEKYSNIRDLLNRYPAQIPQKGLFPFTLFKKGEFLRVIGLYDEAIEALEQALKSDVKNGFIHYNLALAYEKKGMNEKVMEEFLKVIRINPDNTEAHSKLGLLFFNQGNLSMSLEEFKAVLRLDPQSALACNNIGVVYNAMGKPDGAIKAWRKALQVNPNHVQARINLYKALGSPAKKTDVNQ